MEKLETEMKRKMEIETGNINANKRRTNHWCNILFVVCFVITQAIVMWLALWVVLAFIPVLYCVITTFSVNE